MTSGNSYTIEEVMLAIKMVSCNRLYKENGSLRME